MQKLLESLEGVNRFDKNSFYSFSRKWKHGYINPVEYCKAICNRQQANEDFKNTDVVLILGANDVVNPAAKTDPASPIYGMPILEVEQAKLVIVNKRSMKPGYAGIENELFFQPKTSMLFGDAKGVLQKLVAEIKEL